MRRVPLRRIMIVGGGLAAARAAERLSERGFDGRLDIVAAEPDGPYRRPALSDGVLTGDLGLRSLRLACRTPRLTRWLHGRRAVALDRAQRRVKLDDGRQLPYDGLIVATGVQPRTLAALRDVDAARVHHLHTFADARRLREVARRSRRVVVIGGGLIGTEVAASLVSHGVAVTLVEPSAQLLQHSVGERLGAALTALHRRRGVDVRTATALAAVESCQRGRLRVQLTDDAAVDADAVVVAVGSTPDVAWLQGTGVDISNGVLCDPWLFTVGSLDDDIVAAGDCARWRNARFDAHAARVEQWVTSILMARHAADSLLDGREHARPFTPVPWGWTEQWGVRVHMVGAPRAAVERRVIDGDPDALRGALSLHDAAGRIVGGVSADRPGATLQLTAMVAAQWPEPLGGTPVWEGARPDDLVAAGQELSSAEDGLPADRRAYPRPSAPAPVPAPA